MVSADSFQKALPAFRGAPAPARPRFPLLLARTRLHRLLEGVTGRLFRLRQPAAAATLTAWAVLAAGSRTAQAQTEAMEPSSADCPGLTVGEIQIENRSVFHFDDPDPKGRLQRLVRFVSDRLHRRTRRSFLEDELLFRVGDCLDQFRISESARILRAYPFIAEASARVLDEPTPGAASGARSVVVETQDDWTLKLNVVPKRRGGFGFTRADLFEESLWGTGTRLGVFWRERDEQRDLGAEVRAPRLLGTRLDGALTGGRTRTGVFFEESLAYPFVGEVGRYAFVESFSRREDLFSFAAAAGLPFTHVLLPMESRRAAATLGLRTGEPGDFTVLAAGLAWEHTSFGDFPSGVEVVPGLDFSVREAASAETVALLRPHAVARTATRALVLVGKRNIQYVARSGLDKIRGEQDVATGAQALLSVGTTLGWSLFREHQARLSLFAGAAGPSWVFNSALGIEGARWGGEPTLRDVLGEFDAYLYWQPGRAARQTLVAHVSASGGWNNSVPFQMTLGSPTGGIRGIAPEDFPAGRRVVLNLEDRIALGGPFADVLGVGVVVFLDAGAGWRGDAPFGADSGLRASAGAGLRFGFPPETRNVYGLDVAVPLGGAGLRGARLHVGVSQIASLLKGFGDRQVRRSRAVRTPETLFGRLAR